MVVSREIAEAKYRAGIERIGGAAKYYECGKLAENGPAIQVAQCLQAAKRAKTTDDFVRAWVSRMYGGYTSAPTGVIRV